MVGIIKLFTSFIKNILNFIKKLFGFPLRLLLLVILIDLPILLGVYLSLQQVLAGQNRLEADLVVVQTTQFNLLQQIATKSATPTPQVRPITVVGVGK